LLTGVRQAKGGPEESAARRGWRSCAYALRIRRMPQIAPLEAYGPSVGVKKNGRRQFGHQVVVVFEVSGQRPPASSGLRAAENVDVIVSRTICLPASTTCAPTSLAIR